MVIHTLLHLAAYGLLYWRWNRIFKRIGLDRASEVMVWLLPLWLVFSQFWADLGYLNVYVFMALLATLLIEAVLNERLGLSVLWLSIILQIKPQWAFAVGVPLLLRRYRFFIILVISTIVAYIGILGVVMVLVEPTYIWHQYGDYFQFLWNMRSNLVWRGPDDPFLGYDHSITQVVVYLLGTTTATLHLATGIKVLLLIPLAVLGVRYLSLGPRRRIGHETPHQSLQLAFALYLAAFIWLDVVWEVTFGIVVFTYLLAVLENGRAKMWAWVVFFPYALVDFWQVFSVATLGFEIIVPGPFVLTDPGIYIPLVMIVIVAFYALLIKQLWSNIPVQMEIAADGL
jgi:hypothetical protein